MRLDVALCLPQEVESVSVIRGIVSEALVSLGIAAGCIDDIRLALSEACTNVIEHAAADDEYEIRLQVDDERCVISVANTGDHFDAAGLDGIMPSTSSSSGRGVAIMHAVMDQVAFSSEPEIGTIVHLVKALELEPDGAMSRLRHDD